MKLGYQDAGSWTLLKNTPLERRQAAWLYAQFTVSKTVSLKKTLVGLTPIRHSDLVSEVMSERAPYLGGFVEFYRSRGREIWTPTGTNVPDYPQMSTLWWRNIWPAVAGKLTSTQAMNNLAAAMDEVLLNLSQDSNLGCRPVLNEQKPEAYWINTPGSPKPAITKKASGETWSYEEAIKAWD